MNDNYYNSNNNLDSNRIRGDNDGTSSDLGWVGDNDLVSSSWEGQHWYCCGRQTNAQREGDGDGHDLRRKKQRRQKQQQQHSSRGSSMDASVGVGGGRGTSVYMSYCMMYNLQHNLPILDGCGDYDLYSELNGPKLPPPHLPHSSSPSTSLSSTIMDEFTSNKGSFRKMTRRQRGLFLPQRYHLKEIHEYDPNSIWILNIRPVDDWIDSVLHHRNENHEDDYSIYGRVDDRFYRNRHRTNETNIRDNARDEDDAMYERDVPSSLAKQLIEEVQLQETRRNNGAGINDGRESNGAHFIPTPKGKKETRKFLRDLYISHLDHVRSYAKSVNHRLVEVNITLPDAGLHLIRAIGWIDDNSVPSNILRNEQLDTSMSSTNGTFSSTPWKETKTSLLLQRARSCWRRHNAGNHRRFDMAE